MKDDKIKQVIHEIYTQYSKLDTDINILGKTYESQQLRIELIVLLTNKLKELQNE